jgi:hypothetical protein
MEVGDQLHAPAALPSEEGDPVPIGYETGWTPEPAWTICSSANFELCLESNSGLSENKKKKENKLCNLHTSEINERHYETVKTVVTVWEAPLHNRKEYHK